MKELFIMTWKRWIQRVAIAKEHNELIGQLLQRKTKVLIPKPKRKKNTIVIVKNFNKMALRITIIKNYRQMNKHIVLALSLSVLANAQQTPAQNNQKSILILNASAYW
jgi:HD-GYP domain-containing protein (c-di-GMP phosphodiesterase class II)